MPSPRSLEHGQELLYGDAGTARLAEKARHAREAHEHVKATSYYLACARAGASFLSHGRWGLNDALKSAREGLRTLNLAQQPDGCAAQGVPAAPFRLHPWAHKFMLQCLSLALSTFFAAGAHVGLADRSRA